MQDAPSERKFVERSGEDRRKNPDRRAGEELATKGELTNMMARLARVDRRSGKDQRKT